MRPLVPWMIALQACVADEPHEAPEDPVARISELTRVVPGPGLPDGLEVLAGNNNLDVAWHGGRLYLAWRTAPTHFASAQARMHVVSSEDQVTWRHEGTFSLGRDLREPQLVSTGEELWLYFALLGTDLLDFEPGGVQRARLLEAGSWTEPEPFGAEGLLVWRIKQMAGRWHMFGYVGGENVYDADGEPIEVHWYASEDGLTWAPAVGDDPVVLAGGGSEVDAELLEDGSLVAVVRNEAGDEDGFGSKICTAPADDLGTWTCATDPRKYDSPLMVQDAGRVWLIARRHLANGGHYDLGQEDLSLSDRFFANQGAYWQSPKRCAVWSVDPATRTVTHVTDLPSRGDTCFPEAVRATEGPGWWVYNYSNDPEGEDLSWIAGQVAETGVYRQRVVLE